MNNINDFKLHTIVWLLPDSFTLQFEIRHKSEERYVVDFCELYQQN